MSIHPVGTGQHSMLLVKEIAVSEDHSPCKRSHVGQSHKHFNGRIVDLLIYSLLLMSNCSNLRFSRS